MGIDMLSIGEIAYATGVSRRMLRHWEEAGLIAPAAVDEHTGYRRYSRTQVGRVRAISALRSVGFALAEIAEVGGADRGVTVRFDVPPADIGDAWISLDTSLEAHGLQTTGVYRQILTAQGGVILQAPLEEPSC